MVNRAFVQVDVLEREIQLAYDEIRIIFRNKINRFISTKSDTHNRLLLNFLIDIFLWSISRRW